MKSLKTRESKPNPLVRSASIAGAALCLALCLFILGMSTETGFAADDANVTVRVQGSDRVWADEKDPATGQENSYTRFDFDFTTFEETDGANNYLPFTVGITYSGLTSGTAYTYDITLIHEKTGQRYDGAGRGNFTASDPDGSLTKSFRLYPGGWRDLTGKWNMEVSIYPSSDPENAISVSSDKNDMSLQIRGFSSIEICADEMHEFGGIRYITKDEIDNDTRLYGLITMEGLTPNTTYDIMGSLGYKETDQDFENIWNFNSDLTDIVATSDENGRMTFKIPYSDIVANYSDVDFFINTFHVRSKSNSSDRYIYLNNGNRSKTNNYCEVASPEYLPGQMMLYVVQDIVPDEKPTLAVVKITNRIAGKDVLLPGAEFKLVKGSDPKGTEVIDTWIQGEDHHETTLELGEYVIVQTSAPEGYKIAAPVAFSLTADDALSRGYNFAGSVDTTTNPDGSSVNYLSIKKDGSSDDDEGEVVFCMNANKPFGNRIDRETKQVLYYTEYDLRDAYLNDVIQRPRIPMDDLREKLKQIVYAGFPNDKAGLKEKYGLTDSELETITQLAIHYYTDSVEYENSFYYMYQYNYYLDKGIDFDSPKMRGAFSELIETDIQVPEGMTVMFYMPTNNYYQTLISTKFRDEDPEKEVIVENIPPEIEEDEQHVKDEDNTDEKGNIIDDKKDENKGDNKPEGRSSQTGDSTFIACAVLLLCLSVFLTAVISCSRKRSL